MKAYRFSVGDRVHIRARRTSSEGVHEHNGEVVTIKARCLFTWAYELVAPLGFWQDGCFVPVK